MPQYNTPMTIVPKIKRSIPYHDLWVSIGLAPLSPESYLLSHLACDAAALLTLNFFFFLTPLSLCPLSGSHICCSFCPESSLPFFAWLAFYHSSSFCSNVSFSEKITPTFQSKVNSISMPCFIDSTYQPMMNMLIS